MLDFGLFFPRNRSILTCLIMKMPTRFALLTSALVATTLGLLPVGANAETRTFTSADGKTMEAEIVSASNVEVVVKLAANNRQVKFPISLLSSEDQEYVQKWASENESFNLRIEAKKETQGSETSTKGDTKTNIRSYVYGVSILNWGRNDLEDAMIKYRIYTDDGSYLEGNHGIELLSSNSTMKFETSGTTLKRCETKRVSGVS